MVRAGWMVGALALSSLAHAEERTCDDPERKIRKAESDAIGFFLQDAQNDLVGAVEAFGCSAPTTPQVAASFWVTQGFVWAMQEDAEKSATAYASAKRVDPGVWNTDFGDKERARYDAALAPEGKPSTIHFRGVGPDDWTAVDGTKSQGAVKLEPGLHLVQVGSGDTARFATVLTVVPGQDADVAVPGGSGASLDSVSATTTVREKGNPAIRIALLSGGLASGAVSGVMFGLSAKEAAAYTDTSGKLDLVATETHGVNSERYRITGIGFATAGLALTTTALVVRF